MKKSFSLIIMLAILLLSSCKNKNNPNSYSDEIEDAVRFQLAVANSMSNFESFDDFKEILNWMLEFSEKSCGCGETIQRC